MRNAHSLMADTVPEMPTIAYNDLFNIEKHEVIESYNNAFFDRYECEFYEYLTKDIHFRRLQSNAPQRIRFSCKSEVPYVSVIFSFNCRGQFVNNLTGRQFATTQHHQSNFIFINTQLFDNSWFFDEDAEHYIINITIDHFKRFLAADNPMFETFYSSLKENNSVLLNERSINITPPVRALLYDIFLFEDKNYFKTLHLKSKFIELLMLQFREYENGGQLTPLTEITDGSLVKMYEVKDIIDSNLAKPCTLVDLAQQVGTNECYLKKHFKQAFGTTVYSYLHTQRMELSKDILLNENKKIGEVAKIAGYKHASHFSTAFKKYFGYLPNQIKIILVTLMQYLEIG